MHRDNKGLAMVKIRGKGSVLPALLASIALCASVHAQSGGFPHTPAALTAETSQKQIVTDEFRFVKPGDAVRIYAIPDTASFLNGFYPIDGEGKIYLPILGKMSITGMSEKALADTLKAFYINYLRYPNLQIRPLIRISLLGGFHKPGLFYVDPDCSMWDAVYLAGGTLFEDGLKRMEWERDRKPVSKDVIPFLQSGQSLRSLGFKSGDQLWTPSKEMQSWWERFGRETIFGELVPIVSTAATLYITYLTFTYVHNR
jgi:protein involved in polysaccharide export with SLBB domain